MTPRVTHVFVRWCVTLCIVAVVLLTPGHGFAFTPEEPSPSPSPSPSASPSADRIVTLGRNSGPPGTKFTVGGSGYGACGDVELSLGNADPDTVKVDDETGKFKTDLTVPKDAKPGPLTVKVSDQCTKVTKRFTVVAPAPPPTTRPPPPAKRPPPSPPPATTPQPSPSQLPAEAPANSFDKVEEIAEQEIKPGRILYNPPEQMRVGEAERIEVRITRQLSDEIFKDLQGKGRPRVEESPITAEMKVELIGKADAFDIRSMSSPIQSVFGSHTEWYWDVTPLSSGVHRLTIKATFIYQGQTFRDLEPFERDVTVAVNPVYSTGRWLGNNWDKVLGALGITAAGVFAFLYQKLRRRLKQQRPVDQ